MKKLLLFLFFYFAIFLTNAQLINKGWLYEPYGGDTTNFNQGGSTSSNIRSWGTYIDKTSNRYLILSTINVKNDSLMVYGLANPILIPLIGKGKCIGRYCPESFFILKFDNGGNFLYYFTIFSGIYSDVNTINMSFDKDNNPILFCTKKNQSNHKFDSSFIDLIDARQQTYRRINFPNNNIFYRTAILCKLDTQGNYLWVNSMEFKCPGKLGSTWIDIENDDKFKPSIVIDTNQVISIYLDVANTYFTNTTDTLTLTDNQGKSSMLFANNIDVFLRFSSTGNFIKLSEPFKNCVSNAAYDARFLRSYSAVSDGINTYSIYSVTTTKPSVFNTSPPIPLITGVNTLLIKRNAQDSILWVKHIRVDTINNIAIQPLDTLNPQYVINFDPNNREIILSTYIFENFYTNTYLTNTQVLSKPGSIYLSRFDLNGKQTWDYLIERGWDLKVESSQIINSAYNKVLKQLIVVGGINASLNTFKIGSFTFDLVALKKKYFPLYLVAIFDNTNNVIYAQLIKQVPININNFSIFNGCGIIPGNDIVDNKGKTFITCTNLNNKNSYELQCNLLIPSLTRVPKSFPGGSYAYLYENTSVLAIDPLKQEDSIVCKSMKSPSKKYIWNKSGVYFDTLSNSMGCDSLLLFNIKVESIPFKLTLSKTNNISCDSTFTNLSAKGGSHYAWFPAYELSDTSISNPLASPKKDITYYVLANDSFGCTSIDSIHIDVSKNEKIKSLSNVFTPNNDGFNDCLSIESVANFKEVETSIFNRWGNEVFNSRNTNACWNGKSSANEDLADGTYFYIIKGQTQCQQQVNQNGSLKLIR